ncbi:MAG: hypothetical protein AAF587_16080 [Bacteroidota bacterium]
MPSNNFLDSLLGTNGSSLGRNGDNSDRLTYYDQIKRTKDLALAGTLIDRTIFRSAYFIRDSDNRLDQEVISLLGNLAETFAQIQNDTGLSPTELGSDTLADTVGKLQTDANAKDFLKTRLQNPPNSLTGILSTVAKRFDLTLDNSSRSFYGKESIFLFAAYRANALFQFSDPEGFASSLLEYVNALKLYLNKELYTKIVAELGLDLTKLSPEQRDLLEESVVNTDLDYSPGQVQNFILKEFDRVNQYGDLILEIDVFLNSPEVNLPPELDRDAIIDQMLDFLVEIGYQSGGPDPIQALENRLNQVEQDLQTTDTNLDSKIDQVEQTLQTADANLDSKIDQVEQTLQTADANLDSKIDQVEQSLQTADANLDSKIDQVEQSLQTADANLDSKINQVEQTLQTADTNLDSKINQVEQTLQTADADLDSKINQVEQEYKSSDDLITQRLDALEAKIKILEEAAKDDLTIIEGIGTQTQKTLNNKDVFSFRQIASMSVKQLKLIVPNIPGRYTHDDVINQAKYIVGVFYDKLQKLRDSKP